MLQSTVSPPLPSTSVFVPGSGKSSRGALGEVAATAVLEGGVSAADIAIDASNTGASAVAKRVSSRDQLPGTMSTSNGSSFKQHSTSLVAAENTLRASHDQLEKMLLANESSAAHRKESVFSSLPLTRAEPEFYSGLSERQQEAMRHERQLADVHAYYREVIEEEKARNENLERELTAVKMETQQAVEKAKELSSQQEKSAKDLRGEIEKERQSGELLAAKAKAQGAEMERLASELKASQKMVEELQAELAKGITAKEGNLKEVTQRAVHAEELLKRTEAELSLLKGVEAARERAVEELQKARVELGEIRGKSSMQEAMIGQLKAERDAMRAELLAFTTSKISLGDQRVLSSSSNEDVMKQMMNMMALQQEQALEQRRQRELEKEKEREQRKGQRVQQQQEQQMQEAQRKNAIDERPLRSIGGYAPHAQTRAAKSTKMEARAPATTSPDNLADRRGARRNGQANYEAAKDYGRRHSIGVKQEKRQFSGSRMASLLAGPTASEGKNEMEGARRGRTKDSQKNATRAAVRLAAELLFVSRFEYLTNRCNHHLFCATRLKRRRLTTKPFSKGVGEAGSASPRACQPRNVACRNCDPTAGRLRTTRVGRFEFVSLSFLLEFISYIFLSKSQRTEINCAERAWQIGSDFRHFPTPPPPYLLLHLRKLTRRVLPMLQRTTRRARRGSS